jgi:hypothetical protein
MLFPTHRVVSGLPPALWERLPELLAERWDLEEVAGVDALERRILAPERGVRSFGLVRGNGEPPLHARLRGAAPADLDVAAVETLVLNDLLGLDADAIAGTDRIVYRHRAHDAVALLDAAGPRSAVALLVPAPTLADVDAVAEADRTMPPKSTFFFPKILDGMVFNQLDPFDP